MAAKKKKSTSKKKSEPKSEKKSEPKGPTLEERVEALERKVAQKLT